MKPGRKPIPTSMKEAAGNPGRRPLNNDPTPTPGAPEPPEHLNDEGRKAWDWLCDTLGTMGILAKSDRAIVSLYCDTWAEYIRARQDVNKYGMILFSKKTDMPFVNPHLNVESMLKKQLMQYLTELGLSPSSRSRINVGEQKPKQDTAKRRYKLVG